jgi:hypothetical protein
MKKILIGLAVAIGAAVFIIFMLSVFIPQSMADFFMSMGAVHYEIELDNELHAVELRELGEGVTADDRLYLMKKMLATSIYAETYQEFSFVDKEFKLGLLEAAEDKTLSLHELEHLRSLHSDIITDDMVDEWIELAKDYQEMEEAREREDDKSQR